MVTIEIKPKIKQNLRLRFRIGTIAGFPIFIHLSVVFLALLIPLFSLKILLIIIMSIVIHELSHAIVCKTRGLGTGTITIWFFGGFFIPLADYKPVSLMTVQERLSNILMTVAGPLSNFILSGLSFSLWKYFQYDLFGYIYNINLWLGIINLFPIFPLDGGKILSIIGSLVLPRKPLLLIPGILSIILGISFFVLGIKGLIDFRIFMQFGTCIGLGIASIKASMKSDEEVENTYHQLIEKEKKLAGIH